MHLYYVLFASARRATRTLRIPHFAPQSTPVQGRDDQIRGAERAISESAVIHGLFPRRIGNSVPGSQVCARFVRTALAPTLEVEIRRGIMKRFAGAMLVKGGYYLNLEHWKLEVVDGASGTLPGKGTDRYLKVPGAALLVLAPLMGLVFVIVLPFIGVAVLLEQAWAKTAHAAGGARHAARLTRTAGVAKR